MPSRNVNLGSDGQGFFQLPRRIYTLTIINATTSSVKFRWRAGADPITLNSNTQVEFEEAEAEEVERIDFDSGPANGTITVSWSEKKPVTR